MIYVIVCHNNFVLKDVMLVSFLLKLSKRSEENITYILTDSQMDAFNVFNIILQPINYLICVQVLVTLLALTLCRKREGVVIV